MADSEMVERVAMEIARKRIGVKPEDWKPDRQLVTTWDLNTARAAIEAMREPTDGMEFDGMFKPFPGESPRLNPSEVRETWQAMIDVALNTHSEPQG